MSYRVRHCELHRRLFDSFLHGPVKLIAGAAARFVRRIADLHLRVAAGKALRVMRGAAASHADRVHLRDFFGNGEKRGHRTERPAHVVLIESGRDHADSGIGELHADVDDSGIEELHFVDADDLHSDLDAREELGTRGHRDRLQAAIIARHDVVGAEAVVDEWLENLNALPGDQRAPQPSNQLFRFSREHSAGDDFDPAAFVTVQMDLREVVSLQDNKIKRYHRMCSSPWYFSQHRWTPNLFESEASRSNRWMCIR